MLEIFYKHKGQLVTTDELSALDRLGYDDILWIDLTSPTGEEKRGIESYLNTTLQSRAQAEEIESSSRYSESETTIFINTNFLIPGPDDYTMEAVSFILCEGIIVSIRHVPLRSFTDLQRRLLANYRTMPTGYHILIGILENRIDLDADMIELMSKEIAQFSRKVGHGGQMGEEFILDINQLQENTMLVRENIVDKQRMISSILKSDKFPRDVFPKLNVLIKDVNSLINHTNFSFERLEYMQNTVLGLINLEQNRIMKIFTFVSLLFMPPTVIASIYGMNVELPLLGGAIDFALIMLIMMVTVVTVSILFRRKKMLK
ncbi:MAG: magnesium and cobalt transport protein CorA [Bacteroidetes bacterium GWF2_41_61]|jgi:magnesium transporter|nr:MAG: magnesium and cobalt transport protein CorA [Bacteroidetes bacterium GWE2_40_15]OFY29463.1 MAG: magnesium and cobalt transport protein CorA [Bacteroidetes bacterium GWF2_41_61]OFY88780.1 MAG: magnesium and cobalt transport protein CorA [Bacteroidetes bacterium RIFOXYA12_FULL_40_10]PKP06255.1 MAG: magnesium and cobalt transport protein CorA [Bacteroidetes bacterium HGW-Bacteroidetes-5]HBG23797.1 magnesium and cobalt transport protein CorA [Rikenellaceae bacterium]